MGSMVLLIGPASRLKAFRKSCLAEPPFEVRLVSSVAEACAAARENKPAAVVLYIDGNADDTAAACRQLRSFGDFPLIAASASLSPGVAISTLEAGADDCVSIEITPRELRARIRAHLRRANEYAQRRQPIVRIGEIEIDRDRREVRAGGTRLALSPKEFALLEYLLTNLERVVRRDELLTKVWELPEGLRSRTLDVHMSRLRQKLAQLPVPLQILTVAGVGYRVSL